MEIKQNLERIVAQLKKVGISRLYIKLSFEEFLVYSVATLLIGLLLINIYSSIGDIRKYKILDDEKEVLAEIEGDYEQLVKDRDYYKSSFYKKLYARESLSLAKESQDIFYIDRGRDIDYSEFEVNPDPILKDNIRFWWLSLIF